MFEKARRTLITWNVGVAISLIVVVVFTMYITISLNLQQEVNDNLRSNAENIIRSIRYVPPTPSGQVPTTPSKSDESDDEHDKPTYKGDDGKMVRENNRFIVSNAFYILVDTKGAITESSLVYTNKSLPDLTVLKSVLEGQTLYKELKVDDASIRLYSAPVRLEGGRIVGMIQVGENLEPYKQQLNTILLIAGVVSLAGLALAVAAALILTRRALIPIKQSMERQREFVADASHELRTPLALIRANAEVALRSKNKNSEQNTELLEDITRETDYLSRLVTDLLTLARSDMEKAELKAEPVELVRLGRSLTREMQPLADARNLALNFDCGDKAEIWVMGDPVRLRQLLLILLDNAIKYTPSGNVDLSVTLDKSHHAIIKVSDTGLGIPEDKLGMIFERFYRVDKSRTRREGGFGLGLSIARWIAQIHNGSIHATSKVGQGSVFSVSLPSRVSHKI
ncbi:HAMP domain-containing sensor histidine kinase [Candidatus Chlorohelix sp.]|uniref:sensor histidine kinase n=1 Tax=Candidatus Chlorohelix sp. TaxID=3139201 RepID=UPI0030629589